MDIFNEIKSEILNISSIVQPIVIKHHNMKHSDGLTQTHQQHVYGEPISTIRKEIWSSDLTIEEKLLLNDALISKMKI